MAAEKESKQEDASEEMTTFLKPESPVAAESHG